MKRESRAGFTLVEVLTVIAIIAILAAIIAGLAGVVQKTAAKRKAKAELMQLESFITDYQAKYGHVPKDVVVLEEALVASHHPLTNLLDPWGMPFQYQASSPATFYLWSQGGSVVADPTQFIGNHP